MAEVQALREKMIAVAEELDLDELANGLYYQHLQMGNSHEKALRIYNVVKSEVTGRYFMERIMVDNQLKMDASRESDGD
tara:strand:+ start:267 stop:503 length:237 start_codon:yes stop_codon:yes gene_type:complete